MSIFRRLRRLFSSERTELTPGPLTAAADALEDVRGEYVSPASGGSDGPDAMQNIAAAGRDAGMFNVLGGTDIVGKSADGYRDSK